MDEYLNALNDIDESLAINNQQIIDVNNVLSEVSSKNLNTETDTETSNNDTVDQLNDITPEFKKTILETTTLLAKLLDQITFSNEQDLELYENDLNNQEKLFDQLNQKIDALNLNINFDELISTLQQQRETDISEITNIQNKNVESSENLFSQLNDVNTILIDNIQNNTEIQKNVESKLTENNQQNINLDEQINQITSTQEENIKNSNTTNQQQLEILNDSNLEQLEILNNTYAEQLEILNNTNIEQLENLNETNMQEFKILNNNSINVQNPTNNQTTENNTILKETIDNNSTTLISLKAAIDTFNTINESEIQNIKQSQNETQEFKNINNVNNNEIQTKNVAPESIIENTLNESTTTNSNENAPVVTSNNSTTQNVTTTSNPTNVTENISPKIVQQVTNNQKLEDLMQQNIVLLEQLVSIQTQNNNRNTILKLKNGPISN